MTIVNVTSDVINELKTTSFSELFLDNCMNSKFLAINRHDNKIIGICFVGGLLNSNGIEIHENFRGQGIGKKLLSEIILECKNRNISFLTGVFKPSNIISIKTHIKIGYIPLFTFYYNKIEGKEIVVILPFNKKGLFLSRILKIFNTRIGNTCFTIFFYLLRPFLKHLIAFTGNAMPKVILSDSIKNFEKVEMTLKNIL